MSSNLAGCAIHLNHLDKAVSIIRGLVSGPPGRRVVANRYRRFVEIRRRQFNSGFSPKDDTRRRRDAPGATGHPPLGGGAVLEDVMRTGKAAARIGSGHRIPAAASASSQQRRQQQRDRDKRDSARDLTGTRRMLAERRLILRAAVHLFVPRCGVTATFYSESCRRRHAEPTGRAGVRRARSRPATP